MEFSRPEHWSGICSLLQGIFPTQELSWGLLHCRWILYQLSYQGSPIFGATQAFSLVVSSRGSSRCSTQVPYRRGFFCGSWALGCEGFSSCGSQTLEHRPRSCGSRLSCSMACEIFLDQGSSPFLLHWQTDSLSLSHQGSPKKSNALFTSGSSLSRTQFKWYLF